MSVLLSRECSICLEEFSSVEDQWTHPGGESHPFHRHCIKTWVQENPTCPNDREPIDPNSVLTRTEIAALRLKEAGASALSAGSLFGAASAAGWAIAGIPGAVAMAIATGVSVSGRARAEEAEEKAEEDDAAAADALAEAEAAGIVARERGSIEALEIARTTEARSDALTAVADASDEKASQLSEIARKAENISNFMTVGAGLLSGSYIGTGALTLTSIVAREVSEEIFDRMRISLRSRRISGSASALGAVAVSILACSYSGVEPASALVLGSVVSGVAAALSSLLTR